VLVGLGVLPHNPINIFKMSSLLIYVPPNFDFQPLPIPGKRKILKAAAKRIFFFLANETR